MMMVSTSQNSSWVMEGLATVTRCHTIRTPNPPLAGEVRTRHRGRGEAATRGGRPPSGLHLHVASRRVLVGLEIPAAGRARRRLLAVELLDPLQPVRPPRARVLLRLRQP